MHKRFAQEAPSVTRPGRNHFTDGWNSLKTCIIAVILLTLNAATGALISEASAESIRHIRRGNFIVHTDATPAQLTACLRRMERVAEMSQRYWGRPLTGKVECYLVSDLAQWDQDDFPSRSAQRVLKRLQGGTDLEPVSDRANPSVKAIIYASTELGVVEHEVVHAYCYQTFGRAGPDWYREGMAEVFAQEVVEPGSGPCRPHTVDQLKACPVPSLRQILTDHRDFSRAIRSSITATVAPAPTFSLADQHDALSTTLTAADVGPALSLPPAWGDQDQRNLQTAHVAYAHSWALCYLLHHNPAYHDRFQVFGRHLLAGTNIELKDVFGSRMEEIDFELRHFSNHVERGYSLNACRWQWQGDATRMEVHDARVVRLRAGAGFQCTGLQVTDGQHYKITASGHWQVSGKSMSANGDSQGRGRLVGAILNDFQLSAIHELGTETEWVVPADGLLYLRCQDDWGRVTSNRGRMAIRITRQR